MNIIHHCCCGIDVHAKTVVVCLIKNGKKQIRSYSMVTDDLPALCRYTAAGTEGPGQSEPSFSALPSASVPTSSS